MTREEAIKELKEYEDGLDLEYATPFDKAILYAIKALEQEDKTWIIGNDNVQIAVRNMPIDMMQKICSIIGNNKNDLGVDCIDRKATLDAIIKRLGIKNEAYLLEAERVIYQQILAMPSVTPQEPRWIPVSERLPEESGEYLVSGIDDEDENYKYVNLAYYAHLNDYDDIYEGQWQDLIIDEKVIAWMPLPEAYTGGMEEGQK